MNRKHAITISLAAALAAIAGSVAATKSVQLGHSGTQTATQTTSALVAQRSASLDRVEHSLKKALAQKPPKLPPLPQAVSGSVQSGALAAQPVPRVRYVRPAPRVVTIHRAGGEHEGELEAEGRDGDHGAQFDD